MSDPAEAQGDAWTLPEIDPGDTPERRRAEARDQIEAAKREGFDTGYRDGSH